MSSDVQPPKKPIGPEEPESAPAKPPAEVEQEAAKGASFAAQMEEKEEVKPKTSFHAAFGKMLGSEATAEQVDRFVNTWVQDQLRQMRKDEQRLHKTWRGIR